MYSVGAKCACSSIRRQRPAYRRQAKECMARSRPSGKMHCITNQNLDHSASPKPAKDCQPVERRHLLISTVAVLTALSIRPAHAKAPKTTSAGENVGFLSDEEVDRERAAHRMKRAFDGKVAVQGKKDKRWYDLKVEPNMPGLVYFRRDDGEVFYVAYGSLSQCDLADDDMVGALSDDAWEGAIRNVEYEGEKPGLVQKLELTREGFYSITSLLRGADQE